MENKDPRGATIILERLTGLLENAGRFEEAKQAEELKNGIVQSTPAELEQAQKGVRGLTGTLIHGKLTQ